MRRIFQFILIISFVYSISYSFVLSRPGDPVVVTPASFVIEQVALDGNNINAWIYNTGIFNQDLRINNTPGFEWPKYSGSFAIFTSGFCIGARVNGALREAMASYKGEYAPGYIVDSSGHPVARTDSHFKIYCVRSTDSWITNPDWLNWGLMVPYGAPYVDVNHNGVYEPLIDTPGVRFATQTLFACLTDGFPERHMIGEGFGGGTAPLYAEVHFTAWVYNFSFLNDVQFLKWEVVNKNNTAWDSTCFAYVSDPDLGCANDDLVGCDSTLKLGFCYNGEEVDCAGSYRYPGVVPAVGIELLEGAIKRTGNTNTPFGLSSCNYFKGTSVPGPDCESDPNGEQYAAYNLMRCIKKDGTPWVIPPGGQSNVTKYCYSGDPETGHGWLEDTPGTVTGSIWNCGGPNSFNGTYHSNNAWGDRRLILSSGSGNFTVNPGEKQIIAVAEIMAIGNSRLNSVTILKNIAQQVRNYYLIGIEPISTQVPSGFVLYQNYPNPFNPTTKIKFSVPPYKGGQGDGLSFEVITLKIFDVLGREVTTLVNEKLVPGTFEIGWNASNYPSGVYFYKLTADKYSETKRMILLK